jgi:hypothetical protein
LNNLEDEIKSYIPDFKKSYNKDTKKAYNKNDLIEFLIKLKKDNNKYIDKEDLD